MPGARHGAEPLRPASSSALRRAAPPGARLHEEGVGESRGACLPPGAGLGPSGSPEAQPPCSVPRILPIVHLPRPPCTEPASLLIRHESPKPVFAPGAFATVPSNVAFQTTPTSCPAVRGVRRPPSLPGPFLPGAPGEQPSLSHYEAKVLG